jgi:hypothetical protein
VPQCTPSAWKIGVEKCCNEEGAIVRSTDASVVVHANEIKGVVGCAPIRLFERARTNAACDYDSFTPLVPVS